MSTKPPTVIKFEPKAPPNPTALPLNIHWELFARLERDCDCVAAGWQRLCDRKQEKLEDPVSYLAETGGLGALKRCKKTLAFFDRELGPYVEDDGEFIRIAKAAICARVGLMVSAFPNGAPPAPEAYVRTLAEYAYDAEPCPYTLESACREVERACKFLPMPAEFLPILSKQQDIWEKRWGAIHCVSRMEIDRRKGAPKKIEGPRDA
jgi:hypothetical protein